MRIHELHIDSFGVLKEVKARDIRRGVNVLYGTNEFGKTTLLEFIRGILFGFPTKRTSGRNPYIPLNGMPRSGSVICEMNDGEILRIQRTEGANGGSVMMSGENGQFRGQERLNGLLNHASAELFHNIFAFTLDELQALGYLQGNEIKNRIYGAGLGLGPSALFQIEKTLQTRRDTLFKIRSKKNKLAEGFERISCLQQTIRETQKAFSCYDELQTQNRTLDKKNNELGTTLSNLERKRRELEAMADIYPTYLEWQKTESELNAYSVRVDLPDHAGKTLNRILEETKALANRIEEEEDAKRNLQFEMDGVSVNSELLDREKEISKLRNMTEQIRATLQDRIALKEKRERLDYEIQSDIQSSGLGWNEENFLGFSITDPEREEIQIYRESLDLKRQEIARAKERLQECRDETTKKRSEVFRPPKWLRVGTYSLLGLGITGIIFGTVWLNPAVLILSATIFCLGGIGLRMILKSHSDLSRQDELEPVLIKRLEEFENKSDELYQKWKDWLNSRCLDVLLSPVQTEKAISSIKEIQNQAFRRDELDQRLKDMAESIDKAETLTKTVLPLLGQVAGDYLPSDIENLCAAFDTAVRFREKVTTMETQLKSLSKKVDHLNEQFINKQKELEDFTQSAGAKTTEEFLELCRQSQRIRELEKLSEEKRGYIQSRTGLGKNFVEISNTLKKTQPDQIQADLNAVIRSIKETQTDRDTIILKMGEIRNRIEQLDSDEKLSQLQQDAAIQKTELNRLAKEWSIVEIANHLLNKTKRKYECERQPKVLHSAEESFAGITNHRYNRIYFSLDSNEIHIANSGSEVKTPGQMSRGTREQLYLAMRLGLIEHYETRSEPLPIVMDDVLVNFDDDRRKRVMEILNRFAENRQIIILTCHRQTLKTYQGLGAHPISIDKMTDF